MARPRLDSFRWRLSVLPLAAVGWLPPLPLQPVSAEARLGLPIWLPFDDPPPSVA
jgi:hypothetical protein